MNKKKAAGNDGFCSNELKVVADKIAWQLTILFNQSFETGEISPTSKLGTLYLILNLERRT